MALLALRTRGLLSVFSRNNVTHRELAVKYLSRAQVRSLDRRAIEHYGVPGPVLMENAGRGAAELLHSLGIHGPVVICCGKGNNGGDGFVIARHLDNRRVAVKVLLFAHPQELTGDAATAYRIVAMSELPVIIPALLMPKAKLSSLPLNQRASAVVTATICDSAPSPTRVRPSTMV